MSANWIAWRCVLRIVVVVLIATIGAGLGICQQKAAKAAAPVYRIVFDRVDTGEYATFPGIDVFVIDSNGKNQKRLTSDHRSHAPAWSADGSKIAFLTEERKPAGTKYFTDFDRLVQYRDFLKMPRELTVMNADGKNPTKIAAVGNGARGIVWFPDDKEIGVRSLHVGERHLLADTAAVPGAYKIKMETQEQYQGGQFNEETLKQYLSGSIKQPYGVCIGRYSCLLEWTPPVDNFMPTLMASTYFLYGSMPGADNVNLYADVTQSLRVVSVDGSGETFPVEAYDLAWAADGKSIAYSTFFKEQFSILYVNEVADGQVVDGAVRALTAEALDAHGPAWSADGSRIAFMGLWQKTSQIFVIGADGKGLTQISSNKKLSCYHPSWSPDGKWIVAACRKAVIDSVRPLNAEFGQETRLYLFDLSRPGAKPREITKCDCGDGNPSFAPVAAGATVQ
jgi:dipeptidyl aminopeptidase/acylaminoacyl peptidase